MKSFHALLAALVAFSSANVFSGGDAPLPVAEKSGRSWVASFSIGSAWENAGKTQAFYLDPQVENAYINYKSSSSLVFGELFLGMQKSLSPSWDVQLGLAAATTGDADLNGIIWADADPEFDNHSYHYKIKHSRVALKGKLLKKDCRWLTPWVSVSLGVGFNRAHDFTNTPLIFEALPSVNFTDNTKTTFAYTVAVGVQKEISKHVQVGVGYEFADWGKNQLSPAQNQTFDTSLKQSHLYTNSVLVSFTYTSNPLEDDQYES